MNQEKNQSTNKRVEGKIAGENIARNSKRTISKTSFFIMGGIALLVIIGLGIGLYHSGNQSKIRAQEIEKLYLDNDVLAGQVLMHDSIVDEWMLALEEIESDLISVQGKEQKIKLSEFDPEKTPDLRESILSEIQSVNTIMDRNRAKINSLRKQLKESGFKIDALEEKLIALQSFVEQRDSVITFLKDDLILKDFQLAELNGVVDSLNINLNKVEETVEMKEAELNKAFFAKGNYKDLKEKGIVDKEGGFLGLGGNKTISDEVAESYFEEVGIKETNKIAVNAKKAKLITEHPVDSYELVQNDTLIAYIDIKKPDEFWRISRYAVIETK